MNDPVKSAEGLMRIAFADSNEQPCRAQDSSTAFPASMWLGRETEAMHLDAESAKPIATILDRFVGTGSIAKEPYLGRRTVLAGLLRLHDLIDGDGPKESALRYAMRCAMDTAAGLRREPPDLATYGEPGRRRTVWILRFEDAEVGEMTFDSSIYGELDAELLAREAFEKHIQNWNCTLFHTAPGTSKAESDARMQELLRAAAEKASERHKYGVSPIFRTLLEAAGDAKDDKARTGPMLMAWRSSLRRRVRELRSDVESKRDTVALYERLLSKAKDEEERSITQIDLEERRSSLAAILIDLEKAEAALAQCDVDPLSNFLPIGTEVSVRKVEAESINAIPVAGSRAVVVGYNIGSDRCNVLAFLQDTKDERGGVYSMFDEDDDPEEREYRPAKFNYRRDEMDVVRYGVFVGGGENLVPGYHATHRHGDPDKPSILDGHNMLIESCGFTWRTQMINDVPENTQIHPDASYFLEWMRPIGESK